MKKPRCSTWAGARTVALVILALPAMVLALTPPAKAQPRTLGSPTIDTSLFESREVERSLARYERLVQQASGVERMDPPRAILLLKALGDTDEQLVRSIESSPLWRKLGVAERRSCVAERVECHRKHGARQDCGVQFATCALARSSQQTTPASPRFVLQPRPPGVLPDLSCNGTCVCDTGKDCINMVADCCNSSHTCTQDGKSCSCTHNGTC